MPSCAAFNCVNRQYKGCGKTFHRLPSKDSEKKLWLVKLKRENFFPSPKAVLCSDHFEASCFDRIGQTVRLKQNSLPTIFDFPAHLLTKKITPRKPIEKKELITEQSDCILTDLYNIPSVSANVSNFKNDHQYAIRDSPCTIKRKLDDTIDQMKGLKKRLKHSQQVSRRVKKKCQSLATVVETLQQKQMISNNCAAMLENTFSGVPLAVMKRVLKNNSGKISRESYPDVLKAFALTLQFYSTKAYKYVRKTFNLALPHPSALRRWYSVVNGEPGFTEEAFCALEMKMETLCYVLL